MAEDRSEQSLKWSAIDVDDFVVGQGIQAQPSVIRLPQGGHNCFNYKYLKVGILTRGMTTTLGTGGSGVQIAAMTNRKRLHLRLISSAISTRLKSGVLR
jgi:hypothetical protein